MPRPDSRAPHALRPVEMTLGFHRPSEGSVLYRAGSTVVLCTASFDERVPPFLEGQNKGWLTAEYQMHPRANPKRQERDGRGKGLSGRTQEIQRLVGRALRAALDLTALGPRTVTIDCDVLEADGGTRTASITGGYVALALGVAKLVGAGVLKKGVLREPVAATSVGCLGGPTAHDLVLDLVYLEDSRADVDLNVVANAAGQLIEVQGTAEGEPIERATLDAMVDLAQKGVHELCKIQRDTLARAGVDLAAVVGR
jgi:ribonuclease PH